MEFIVSDCNRCGGICCQCLVTHGVTLPFWEEVETSRVRAINPWIPLDFDTEQYQWAQCKLLSENGLCTDYLNRPDFCRSYPNIDVLLEEYLSGLAWMYSPWCYYRAEILEFKGIPYKVLETGLQCREAYMKQNDPQD